MLRSIYVGGECNTDNDSNSIVQQSEYLQAVKRSIISPPSIDTMFFLAAVPQDVLSIVSLEISICALFTSSARTIVRGLLPFKQH